MGRAALPPLPAPGGWPGPVFVMGATGTVGGEIVRQLAPSGAELWAAVRDPERATLPPGVRPVPFDVADPATYGALRGAAVLFAMWPPGTGVTDLGRLFAAARAAGVRRVVFLSILGAERLSFLPHRQIEQELERSGLDAVLLRSGYFMQNLTGIHAPEVRRGELFIPSGEGRTSVVDVRDVAAVAGRELARPLAAPAVRAWSLTGPQALTFTEMGHLLGVALNRPVRHVSPGPVTFVRTVTGWGTPRGLALFMLAEYTVARLGLAARLTGDVQAALGRPPIPFARFAEDYRDVWLREA
ncbi:uncharacterized protein YbjT (DUF2867 family) [Deinococcus sp. HSC-46F16]|uniref:NAD(P)H-binding protein n=1 Tax=Deinococcus sp. HSC-46F16 TaxID=2910968 RepID=UPI00209CF00C|nr:NAD(P)H-binding protein [Deinococcus sp. HSC-46F16]MCP2014480.1 uncharacterized protein YbjT (DUF2867 family) [Deinococcus sp. HSC-46F16]